MKKLFVSILALAAFAACQSDFSEDVDVAAPQLGGGYNKGAYTLYAEVGVENATTKATYDDNLKATWEENDQIALLQEHANYSSTFTGVGVLNIKEGWGTNSASFNGNISVDSNAPRIYHVAYPASAVKFSTTSSLTLVGDISYENFATLAYQLKASGTYDYTYNSTLNITVPTTQNGKWEPYMYASTSSAASSDNIGSMSLTTLTGAIAIRAFEADGVTPKKLSKITITSSDADIAGTFSGTSSSVGSLGTVTGDMTAWHSTFEEDSAKSKARASLESKVEGMEPASTSVTKAMSLSFVGGEKSITLTGLENIPMDSDGYYTYYVNVAPATVGTLEIKVLDTNGGEAERVVNDYSFAAGHRKGFKLVWEEAALIPGTIESWYNNWSTSSFELAGSTIYARNIGVQGVPAEQVLALGVEIDGTLHAASAQAGVLLRDELKIEGVSNGTYSICTYAKILLNGYEKELRGDAQSVVVTTIPTATYSIYSSYSNNNSKSLRNDVYGNELHAKVDLSDAYIQTNFVKSATFTYGGTNQALTIGSEWETTVGYGAHSTSITVVLQNGYTLSSGNYTTHVTGIPYTLNPSSNDGWSTSGGISWGSYVKFGNGTSGSFNITKSFHAPADIDVKVYCSGSAGYASVGTTFSIHFSGTQIFSKDSGSFKYSGTSFECNNVKTTLKSSNTSVKLNSSYGMGSTHSRVNSFTINYDI